MSPAQLTEDNKCQLISKNKAKINDLAQSRQQQTQTLKQVVIYVQVSYLGAGPVANITTIVLRRIKASH